MYLHIQESAGSAYAQLYTQFMVQDYNQLDRATGNTIYFLHMPPLCTGLCTQPCVVKVPPDGVLPARRILLTSPYLGRPSCNTRASCGLLAPCLVSPCMHPQVDR